MRTNTELSAMPPAYFVLNEGDMGVIRFYTDVQAGSVEAQGGETETRYSATEWTMLTPWQDDLESRIMADPPAWLARVKAVTAAEETAAELEQLKKTATDDAVCELAELVATLVDAVVELASLIA